MIQNGPRMNVVSFTRLDQVALELPPNDSDFVTIPLAPISALGGRTAPSGHGGMLPPQQCLKIVGKDAFGHAVFEVAEGDVPRKFVAGTAAPPDRQKPDVDGTRIDTGGITAVPPPSVRYQEAQRGVMDIVGDADLSTINTRQGQGQEPDA